MTGRLVVVPARSRILLRSVGYGAATGATMGALVATAIGFVVSLAALDPAGILVGLLFAAPIAAVIGGVIGVACGLTGGIGLITVRSHAAASRGAIRAVAACGAGLLPAAWLMAIAAGSGEPFSPVLAALTVVVFALAAAIGPTAFYGRSPRRRRRPHHLSSGRGQS